MWKNINQLRDQDKKSQNNSAQADPKVGIKEKVIRNFKKIN